MPQKYNNYLKPYSRSLRNNSTLSEILLWNELKQRKIAGLQFYRQKPLLKYIVDFYCPEIKLVIEIDGKYHSGGEQQIEDDLREKELMDSGLGFIRVSEMDVRTRMGWVIEYIEEYIYDFRKVGVG